MMKTLNEKQWARFKMFGKTGLFCLSAAKSSIDSIRLIDGKDKTVPYVTRSDANNGVAQFVSKQNYEYGSNPPGSISIGLDTQTSFYQPHKFVTGQNIQLVSGDTVNPNSAFFYITVLKIQMHSKFNWGGYGATLNRLKHLEALLPVTSEGNPDTEYMEEYIRDKKSEFLSSYRRYALRVLDELGDIASLPALGEKEWLPFSIPAIFDIYNGVRLVADKAKPGKRPFIGAVDNNNGVARFLEDTNASLDRNVLGVNYNGSVAVSFYHPYDCIFSDDVKRFHLKNFQDGKFVLLFMKTVIQQQGIKFGYAYKFNSKRMNATSILLPVNKDQTPDYEYMEQYIKNLMIKKYQQYMDYLESNYHQELNRQISDESLDISSQ